MGYFPQQTSYAVKNDSGYDSFSNQINNDPYYSQQVGNQQQGHHPNYPYPYANSRNFNTQYPGQQISQNYGQDMSFRNQYGGQNPPFQYNGRQRAPIQNHQINHGSYQHAHQFAVPQQINDHQYTYQQYPPSNQVSSYPGQGSYISRGKNSCCILCNSTRKCVTILLIFTGVDIGQNYSTHPSNGYVEQVIKNKVKT